MKEIFFNKDVHIYIIEEVLTNFNSEREKLNRVFVFKKVFVPLKTVRIEF